MGDRVAEAADVASVAGRVVGAGARVTVAAGSGLVRVEDLLTQAVAKADAVTPEGFRVPAGVRITPM
ncbi:hypothetical protein B5P19_00580 [Clavibacter sepedonicus]|uniref:Uncharacterized protein n=1 Tax=Clavibacter sepedonicus TaxID=31964 RepID=B0RGD6_CLASE|nr:hypothetical protein B5P19_00580 [Clavibacter sepedonicus]OQJ55127.1 hypothetical protein B5P20_14265 [Clavibacter sepedonicus]CAQ01192.1 hypothetical protein CMS1078 [Clavibacter sepedonicus]